MLRALRKSIPDSSMDKAGYNRIRKNTGVQVVGLKLKEGQDFLE